MTKTIGKVIAVVLAAGVLTGGVCAMGYVTRKDGKWFKESDIAAWSWNKDKQPNGGTADDEQTPGDGAVITENKSHGIALTSARIAPEDYAAYGISPQAESARTITATLTPAVTTNKNVIWTSSDPKVVVTPLAGNSLTATVTVTGPLETQATITCTSEADPNVKATVTVDWVKGLVMNANINSNITSIRNAFNLNVTYDTGTLTPDSIVGTLYVNMDNSLANYLERRGALLGDVETVIEIQNFDIIQNSSLTFADCFLKNKAESGHEDFYRFLAEYFYGQENCRVLNWSFDEAKTYYDGVQYKHYTDEENGMSGFGSVNVANFNDVTITPTDLNISTDHIICG